MTRRDKADFIRSLTRSIAADLIRKVKNMPDEWDGIELRQLLADKFAHEVSAVMRNDRRRYRAYRNTISTTII